MSEPRHISAILPAAMKRIRARYTSTALCGHLILAGEMIGYDHETKRTLCTVCADAVQAKAGRAKQTAANERMKVE